MRLQSTLDTGLNWRLQTTNESPTFLKLGVETCEIVYLNCFRTGFCKLRVVRDHKFVLQHSKLH